jgi:hypothetical protein
MQHLGSRAFRVRNLGDVELQDLKLQDLKLQDLKLQDLKLLGCQALGRLRFQVHASLGGT